MKILIAEDDATSRLVLEHLLKKWDHDVTSTSEGNEAWAALQEDKAPRLAILDWMMPGMDGVEICRRVRQQAVLEPRYIILLTALDRKEDVITGLEAGANDYVTKPFDKNELRVRISVGQRVLELQSALANRVDELQKVLDHVRKLQGILPICMHCRRIRTDQESWEGLEAYIQENSEAEFSHGLCPECLEKYYPEPNADEEDEGLAALREFSEEDGK